MGRNPRATCDEEIFIKNVLGEEDPKINLRDAREASAAPAVISLGQPQREEHPLNQALMVTKGWKQLEGWIDRLTDAVFRLVLQLAEEGRPGAAEMAAEELAVRADWPTSVGAEEPGMLGVVAEAWAPSLETVPAARKRAPNRPCQLGLVKKFVAAGGDWGAFTRQFKGLYQAVDWTEDEAL
ncbi:unnamed protein product [Lampetra planeri]